MKYELCHDSSRLIRDLWRRYPHSTISKSFPPTSTVAKLFGCARCHKEIISIPPTRRGRAKLISTLGSGSQGCSRPNEVSEVARNRTQQSSSYHTNKVTGQDLDNCRIRTRRASKQYRHRHTRPALEVSQSALATGVNGLVFTVPCMLHP